VWKILLILFIKKCNYTLSLCEKKEQEKSSKSEITNMNIYLYAKIKVYFLKPIIITEIFLSILGKKFNVKFTDIV